MIYLLTTAFIIIGVCYHILQKVRALRIQFPLFGASKIWATFFSEEWDTLLASALGYATFEIAVYITLWNKVVLPVWFSNIGVYVLAAVWGYAGQRLAYKYLGTAESVLSERADTIKKKYGISDDSAAIKNEQAAKELGKDVG